jgi:hypothetical protein
MNEQQKKVSGLIDRIEKHQKALRLSDNQFVARYQRYLGSAKTWRDRLCGRAWNEFGAKLEKWEKKLASFVTELDGGASMDEFYRELPVARYGFAIYDALQGTRTDRRCSVLPGSYGIGKTWTLRRIAFENPTKAVFVSANETWKDSRMQIARGLAMALGCAEGTSAAGTFQNVIEHLRANPVTVLIDEVHEGGVLLMKLVKALINETQAKFILGTYPTAWNRLVTGSTDATAEAQQLLGRTMKPIKTDWIKGLNLRDVEKYLELSTGLNGECRLLAEQILPEVKRGGNLRLLADAVELAKMNADETGEEIDAELVQAAVRELCPTDRK